MGELFLLYVTYPDKGKAEETALHLIEKRLIACANIFPIASVYVWEGKTAKESECVLLAKTVREKLAQAKKEIKAKHPYKIPCILTLKADANAEFFAWARDVIGVGDGC